VSVIEGGRPHRGRSFSHCSFHRDLDGRHVALISDRDGQSDPCVTDADGRDILAIWTADDWAMLAPPSRRHRARHRASPGPPAAAPRAGAGARRGPRLIVDAAARLPDGKRLAFQSDRSGRIEIWIIDVASGALRQRTK
jgi:hypothetical protein